MRDSIGYFSDFADERLGVIRSASGRTLNKMAGSLSADNGTGSIIKGEAEAVMKRVHAQ